MKNVKHTTIKANVVERGNGFPDVGDYVSADGELYRVLKSGSRIEAQDAGYGNICIGYELESADWSDLKEDEEPHESSAIL